MALACLLAFWTCGDTTQMDRLFRRSGLIREKWDDVHYADGQTYGETTLSRAASVTTDYYTPQSEGETDEIGVNGERRSTRSSVIETNVSRPTVSAVHDRERERIETITYLEKRLRELEAENERLRRERDVAETRQRSGETMSDDSQMTVRQWFATQFRRFKP